MQPWCKECKNAFMHGKIENMNELCFCERKNLFIEKIWNGFIVLHWFCTDKNFTYHSSKASSNECSPGRITSSSTHCCTNAFHQVAACYKTMQTCLEGLWQAWKEKCSVSIVFCILERNYSTYICQRQWFKYLSNGLHVSMGYKLINHAGCWQNTRRIRKPRAAGGHRVSSRVGFHGLSFRSREGC